MNKKECSFVDRWEKEITLFSRDWWTHNHGFIFTFIFFQINASCRSNKQKVLSLMRPLKGFTNRVDPSVSHTTSERRDLHFARQAIADKCKNQWDLHWAAYLPLCCTTQIVHVKTFSRSMNLTVIALSAQIGLNYPQQLHPRPAFTPSTPVLHFSSMPGPSAPASSLLWERWSLAPARKPVDPELWCDFHSRPVSSLWTCPHMCRLCLTLVTFTGPDTDLWINFLARPHTCFIILVHLLEAPSSHSQAGLA